MLQDGKNCMFITNLCNKDLSDRTLVLSEQYAIELAALSKYLDSQNTIRLRITINMVFDKNLSYHLLVDVAF